MLEYSALHAEISIMAIARSKARNAVTALLRHHPVVAILGARQVGKTTLARTIARDATGAVTWFDLEDPDDLARLAEPALALRELRGLVVLDEVQRLPGLFAVLRVLADRPRRPARFLVLGSASPELLRQSAETLAGRIAFHELRGFSLAEVGIRAWPRLWLRGGFPRAYTAVTDAASARWRRDFVRTFLERDIPQLGIDIPAPTLRRFWSMLAHYHGQIWNASELARAFGVADTTVRRYLDLLTAAFVVRQLPAWFENLGKRQVKAPKIYLADSGLLHTLLGLTSRRDLERHPKIGASWEGFALQETIDRLGARPEECFFWATHAGAELDLLVVRGRKRLGFEFKRTAAPTLTRSMRSARDDLRLERLDVIHAGAHTFPLAPDVRAVALSRLTEDLAGAG
jgi:predicted AAA+ superfamily ATPase